MRKSSLGAFGVAALLGVTGAITAVAPATAAETVGLHNTTADVGECPIDGAGWHFVAPPKSKTDFIAITLYLDGMDDPYVVPSWVEEPLHGDAYVAVPTGFSVTDLTGGEFVVDGPINGNVRLSHICGGDIPLYEELTVTKTVTTSYDRTHKWDIAKSVGPESVKLYVPGQGDDKPSTATVEWTVEVDYLGAEDSDGTVSGTITIENTGTLDADIQNVTDTFGESDRPVDCGVEFPYTLPVGESLECGYGFTVEGKPTGDNLATVTTELDVYSGTAAVTWDEPEVEIDKTVTVTDAYDGGAPVVLGTLTEESDEFVYTRDFDWNDYDVEGDENCGTFTYPNVAKLLGDAGEVSGFQVASVPREIGSAEASHTVAVQCLVEQSETAWTEGTRYVQQGNWAMYTEKSALDPGPVTLRAGQTIDVGTAWLDGGTLHVSLTGGWEFAGGKDTLKVEAYTSTPKAQNPKPGQFTYKKTATGSEATIDVPTAGILYYGIHLDVVKWVPDPNF